MNVFRSTGFTMIGAIGMTFVLITGGLDLSVGSVLALGGVATGLAFQAGLPTPVAILIGIFIGVVIGCINGLMVTRAKIPPLIVTLGMMYIARGIVSVLTKGTPIYPLPEGFQALEQTRFFTIPAIVFIALSIAIIAHFILSKTPFGRSVYAVGGNAEAARISGINNRKIVFSAYLIASTLAAFTGIFVAARLGSATATAGTGFELTVICAAIIGGTSNFGGLGSIIGTVFGALFMEILSNSLTLMRIPVYWQLLVVGFILILAVWVDQYRRSWLQKKSV